VLILGSRRGGLAVGASFQQVFRFEAEAPNGCADPGPFFGEKFLALAPEQQMARADIDEHAAASPDLHQPFASQLSIAIQNRKD